MVSGGGPAELGDLPLEQVRTAALERAAALGCSHAEVRVERLRSQFVALRDGRVETTVDDTEVGVGLRVVRRGSIGFAATVDLHPDAAAGLADEAAGLADATAAALGRPVELADEPPHGEVQWSSPYEVDPTTVAVADKVALLDDWSGRLLGAPGVDHVAARVLAVVEDKHFADLTGTVTTQRRVRVFPVVEVVGVDEGSGTFESMRTLAPPVGRGWEYTAGAGWDWDAELDQLPSLLTEKMAAPSVEAGTFDLVIDPSNLWLTIHESVGHATELDRALGYEAAYAGTSFATVDQLGSLRYGSPVMHVVGDRTTPHGLATVGYDDEGVAGQSFDIVRDGVLVGYQLDRRMAVDNGFPRSNGCAFADSPLHVPIQRMANVSLQPAPGPGPGPTTEDLVSGVDRGVYVMGDKSWSIDMQRHNFQFTGQRFYRIEGGRLAGQLRDVAYQAQTTEFWGSLEAVGGASTYVLGGAMNCGKGQPGQVAPVSHGCPSALFRGIRVLNTRDEASR
ncbi:MAG TPA: TldD/PmbA family protein [Acidimicrobiales bacterium]|nr:TldD/PmbA family protein [Acidimicrobiales bacterium]